MPIEKGRKLKRVLNPRKLREYIHITREQIEAIILRVAKGETVRAICAEPGQPSNQAFYRWLQDDPELMKLWHAAKLQKAHNLFDEAVDLARVLAEAKGKGASATQINALKVAIETLKWAAARLNPRDYGERAPANPPVAIQINTTLNLDPDKPPQVEGPNVYSLKALPRPMLEGERQAA